MRPLGVPRPYRAPWIQRSTPTVHPLPDHPHRCQELTPTPRLDPFQGQRPGEYSQNPWGRSQGSGCQRKWPSSKLPVAGKSLMEAKVHRERQQSRVTSLCMSATQFTRFHVAETPTPAATHQGTAAKFTSDPHTPTAACPLCSTHSPPHQGGSGLVGPVGLAGDPKSQPA